MPNESAEFDLIIIGAGINGSGVARDAAMRGLKVLLLDKGDISCGTTAWSTRLIHGGLRYLEHGEFGLVRESLREREILLRIAPHLVKALPIVIPIYEGQKRSALALRAGMIAYDLLSFDKSLPAHHWLSRNAALRRVPGLRADGLRAALLYHDAQVEFAERLVLENVLAALQHGATLRTYALVNDIVLTAGALQGISFTDQLTGETKVATSRLIVNAAGPWVDEVLASAGQNGNTPLIGGTKGSHLVVPLFPGSPSTALYLEARHDKRPIFIIPWNEKLLIGTTDTRYQGSLDRVEIDEDEINYLLAEVNRFLPSAGLTLESIAFTYAGVRPLAHTTNQVEQKITRRHFVRQHPHVAGLMSLVGGKLTTYRSLAQETVDLCYQKLRRPAPRSLTAETKLPGACEDLARLRDEIKDQYLISGEQVDRLLRIYGGRAVEVLQIAEKDRDLYEVFDAETAAIGAEIVFSFEYEMARRMADCLLRRTMVGFNTTCGLLALKPAAQLAQRFLGWTDEKVREEIEHYRSTVERMGPRFGRGR